FRRQCARLAEDRLIELTIIASEPFASFDERFIDASKAEPGFDLIFVSQVFFNSGFVIAGLDRLIDEICGEDRLVVVDGYHGFLARPTDLSAVADRIFYLSGGYKYAMAGEGACFMHCPPGIAERPRNTGWYAGFGSLAEAQTGVAYDNTGWRFMGSTFDPSGLYRLEASLGWLDEKRLDAKIIHQHARALQDLLIEGLGHSPASPLRPDTLVLKPDETAIGNFLTFECADAGDVYQRLHRGGIVTDHRGDRLRVGFGLYQCADDVDQLIERFSHLD
ncbi:MAG: aminotransferase class V-fold PLP-dependent enzyme, partial [Aestuariivirgaceae bacterium]